ncbi:DUF305 domain-containing protein [Actinoplanes sp. NPDC051494]|uniref:DUF305 domain-containing protein n=1 Tax=Actinoplanes sp. NPDC051494 TaxID=3363907 RepID=UPI0037A78138
MSRSALKFMMIPLVVVAIGAGVVLVTRSGSDRSAAAPRPSEASTAPQRVIVPGRPGEAAVISDSDKIKAPPGATYNAIDTRFVQMMIVHHEQAVAMSRLAPGRAADTGLAALAARIGAAQTPEIAFLRSWLQARGLPATDPGHDHTTMPGMQSEADMAALTALTGAGFDRMFVTMMTAHHRGAIQMSADVQRGGTDQQLNDVSAEMAVEQGSEIRRMEQLGVV